MFLKITLNFCIASACLLFLVTGVAFPVERVEDAPQKSDTRPDVRIEYVNKLINSSSAAKRVEESGNSSAISIRDKAREYYQQAIDAITAGNDAKATEMLDLASKTMFEAVRHTGTPELIVDKQKIDFENRLQSIQVLMTARHRIRQEKGVSDDDELQGKIESVLAKAGKFYDRQDYVKAKTLIDDAYLQVKAEIEELRGGDTLVRSLNFASKEEEYHYEIDRNDTHKMLFNVLLQEKKPSQATIDMAQKFIEKASILRTRAEKQALRGDYGAAVETLEESTKNVVRAIRGAGIYIPG